MIWDRLIICVSIFYFLQSERVLSVVCPLEEGEVSSSSESMNAVSSLSSSGVSNMSVETVRVGPVSGRARSRVVGLAWPRP